MRRRSKRASAASAIRAMVRTHSTGCFPAAVSPESEAGRAYRAIADKVRAGLEGTRQRQAPRIVMG